MTQLICYWKGVSLSTSPEGESMRLLNPQIRFSFCKKHCNGYNKCENYEAREINDADANDLVGRLEDFDCQIPMVDGYAVVEERHRVYQGGFGN